MNKLLSLLLVLFTFTSAWALDRGTVVVAQGARLQATGRTFANSAGQNWNFSQLERNTQHEFVVVASNGGFEEGDKVWLLPSEFTVVRSAQRESDYLFH